MSATKPAPTHAQRVAKARPVIWYLERHPMEYDSLTTLAHLDATLMGLKLYESGEMEECAVCGKESLLHKFNPEGKNVCIGCAK